MSWSFTAVSYTHLDVYKRQVYGYKKDENGEWVIDEPSANVVKTIFNFVSYGYGRQVVPVEFPGIFPFVVRVGEGAVVVGIAHLLVDVYKRQRWGCRLTSVRGRTG